MVYPIVPYTPAFLHCFLFPVTVVKGIGPNLSDQTSEAERVTDNFLHPSSFNPEPGQAPIYREIVTKNCQLRHSLPRFETLTSRRPRAHLTLGWMAMLKCEFCIPNTIHRCFRRLKLLPAGIDHIKQEYRSILVQFAASSRSVQRYVLLLERTF